MGVRSDVAIAMKECIFQNLSEKAREFLEEWGFEERSVYKPLGEKDQDDAGRLLITEEVKWYSQTYPDIIAFLKHLDDYHDDEDWLIVAATPDYPDSNDGDGGEWHDNPFNLCKHVTVELSWH